MFLSENSPDDPLRSGWKKNNNFPNKMEIPRNLFFGALKPAQHEISNEKFLRCIIEGPRVDFQENFNFEPLT